MDERLTKALDQANLLRTHQNQKEQLRTKAKQNLIHSVGGGIFDIDYALLGQVKNLLDAGYEETVIPDRHFNPVKIQNLEEFYEDLLSKWSEVMNDFYIEYEKLRRSRTVKKVMDLDENSSNKR